MGAGVAFGRAGARLPRGGPLPIPQPGCGRAERPPQEPAVGGHLAVPNRPSSLAMSVRLRPLITACTIASPSVPHRAMITASTELGERLNACAARYSGRPSCWRTKSARRDRRLAKALGTQHTAARREGNTPRGLPFYALDTICRLRHYP
jgi:hypothetical protein